MGDGSMPRTRLALAVLASLLVAACGGPATDAGKDQATAAAEAAALGRNTDKTVFDDMIQTQDKARAVEGITLGRKGDIDAALENSGGSGSDDE
jgi:basic membrane lipoprotein Med (substrate-binding protein (PBP1-ABC) superfamily)